MLLIVGYSANEITMINPNMTSDMENLDYDGTI